jgi:alpha-L-rhamnosidase
MKNISIIVLVLSLMACQSAQENMEGGVFFSNKEAQWIADSRELPTSDSLYYLDQPAPLFRKEFRSKSGVESAKLYITAAGYYNASINGTRVGKEELSPAWTDFSKRIYYTDYDVTSLIKDGENCLGVSLGNGFYNPLPLRKWGHRNLRADLTVGKPVFIAKLRINYKNGESEEIVSDQSWKYSYGPIIKNSVYLGVA